MRRSGTMAKKKSTGAKGSSVKEQPLYLEYRFGQGETLRYTASVTSEQVLRDGGRIVGKQRYEARLDVAEKAYVTPEGNIELAMTIESAWVLMDGVRKTLPSQGKTLSLEMTKKGDILRSDSEVPLSQVPFPEEAVAMGAQWEGKSFFSVPDQSKPHGITYLYTLKGRGEKNGYDCAELSITVKDDNLALDDDLHQQMSIEGSSWFAPREGRLIASFVKTRMSLVSSDSSVECTFVIDITLVPGRA